MNTTWWSSSYSQNLTLFAPQILTNYPFLQFQPNFLGLEYMRTLYQLHEYYAHNLQTLAAMKLESSQSNDTWKPYAFSPVLTQGLSVEKVPEKAIEGLKQEEFNEMTRTKGLRAEITEMVNYFINEFGFSGKTGASNERRKYAPNKALLEVFDALEEKYSKAGKCREDMLRYALRKALTTLRDSLRKQLNISAKAASLKLCERYFGENLEDGVKEDGNDEKSKEEAMEFLLPYKKNSKFSTPNMIFIRKIFGSKLFYQDYLQYLSNFDEILGLDNKKKIPKLIDFIIECVQNDTIHKIKTFKRLPWMKTWLQSTKVIAIELLHSSKSNIHAKRKNVETQREIGYE